LAAVQAADPAILTALTEGGPFTVFAPTDAAFAAALEALGVTAEDLLADTALLTSVLSYHVVPGAWDAASVVAAAGEEGVSVGTLLPGTTVTITVDGESVLVNDATVVATDVLATNGIVHVIDAVLLPPM
jgi:transforming growth factor-beta-induced protein